jgi:hypothetical protein
MPIRLIITVVMTTKKDTSRLGSSILAWFLNVEASILKKILQSHTIMITPKISQLITILVNTSTLKNNNIRNVTIAKANDIRSR